MECPEQLLPRGDDGSFTHHAVLSEFTAYCRRHFEDVSTDQLRLLSVLLNEWFEGPDVDLDNAVADARYRYQHGETQT